MQYSRREGFTPLSFGAKDKQSLYDFFYEYKVTMPAHRADHWRMVQPDPNEVRGQPYMGNVLIRATDGVHALVENHDRKGLIEIHLTNFMGAVRPQGYTTKISMVAKSAKTPTVESRKPKKTKPKNKKPKTKSEFSKMFAEMFK